MTGSLRPFSEKARRIVEETDAIVAASFRVGRTTQIFQIDGSGFRFETEKKLMPIGLLDPEVTDPARPIRQYVHDKHLQLWALLATAGGALPMPSSLNTCKAGPLTGRLRVRSKTGMPGGTILSNSSEESSFFPTIINSESLNVASGVSHKSKPRWLNRCM